MSQTTRLSLSAKTFLGNLWGLTRPYWFSEEKWTARGLLTVILALNLGLVYMAVVLNEWNNLFYNSLQDKNFPEFTHQLLRFTLLAFTHIVMAVYQFYLNLMLQIRWRRWLTDVYFQEWLADRVYYRLELKNYGTDNPDQRISEDLQIFASRSLSLAFGLLRSVVTLASFVVILWGLSGTLTIPLGAGDMAIPGYMVWVALVYAIIGTWLTHLIGRPLVGLNFDQQRFEADLRFSMVRLRENAEGVALYRGEQDERRNLLARFGKVWENWWQLMKYQKRLIWFTSAYEQVATIFPILVAAPRYFSGALQLGGLMQTASAFGRVQDALSWFITAYTDLAHWKASVDRLTTFHGAIVAAERDAQAGSGITIITGVPARVSTRDLELGLPDGRVLLANVTTTVHAGEHLLVTGPSGSGKSTLFRAIAGIWPFGRGQVELPPNGRLLFLPQRPYLPLGTLREGVCYPSAAGDYTDAQVIQALRLCRLENFVGSLDENHQWARRMSPGEQQRLAFARALLYRPDWLFLDEATAAVDHHMEQYLYELVRTHLRDTTLISIAHGPAVAAFHHRQISLVPQDTGVIVLQTGLGSAVAR